MSEETVYFLLQANAEPRALAAVLVCRGAGLRKGANSFYVRGGDHGSNWDDTLPVNPAGASEPTSVGVWAAPFEGGEPKLLGEGDLPMVSPRADVVAFEKERQIWSAPLDGSAPAKKLFTSRGENGGIEWAPDGSRFAFVSRRDAHALVGVYRDSATPILWIAPSTS